jgi:hypothetical protein
MNMLKMTKHIEFAIFDLRFLIGSGRKTLLQICSQIPKESVLIQSQI